MAILTIDTEALDASAAAAERAAAGLAVLRGDAVGRAAGAAGMSGWETDALAWGEAYDVAAADILDALDQLSAAYGSAGFHTRVAASLYAFTEQVSGGAPVPYDVPPEPAASVCPPQAASAVGGRFPVIPEFGQVVSDAAGRAWPSGDAEAMRSAAAAWSSVAVDLEDQVARAFLSATSPLAGQRATDIALLEQHHGQLHRSGLDIAEACRALAGDCMDMAGMVEEAHAQLAAEIGSFVRDVTVSVGVSVLVSVLSAGIGALLANAAAAGRLMMAARVFQTVTDSLAANTGIAQQLLRTSGSTLAGSLPKALQATFLPFSSIMRQPVIRLSGLSGPTPFGRAMETARRAGDYALSFAASGPAGVLSHGLAKAAKTGLDRAAGGPAYGSPAGPAFGRRVIHNLDFGSKFSILAVGASRHHGRLQDAGTTVSPDGYLRAAAAPSVTSLTAASIVMPARLRVKLGVTPQPVGRVAAERGFLATHPRPSSTPGHQKDGSAGSR
jgi:hypothetical protein